MTNFSDVGEFHEKFDIDNVTHRGVYPRVLPEGMLDFRILAMHEELQEFEDACAAGDIAEMADALVDLVYFTLGTAHILGLPWAALWGEVQQANMSKVRATSDGSNSKRNSEFDVVKPEGWKPPDHTPVLKKFGWEV